MTSTLRPQLAILLSGSGSNLQSFINAINAGVLKADIAVVISNKAGVLGLKRANDAGIKTLTIDNLQFKNREEFDSALALSIKDHKPYKYGIEIII